MAVNVYMVFFLAANPNSFRQYLWIYCLVCFGAPALPALICLILRRDSRGIYGNATVSSLQPALTANLTWRADARIMFEAVVLDRRQLELAAHLHLLHAHLGVYFAVGRHLLCRRLPGLPPAQPAAQLDAQQSRKGGFELRCEGFGRKGQPGKAPLLYVSSFCRGLWVIYHDS